MTSITEMVKNALLVRLLNLLDNAEEQGFREYYLTCLEHLLCKD